MLRFIVSVCLLIVIFSCGPMPQVDEAEGTAVLGNPDLMSIECATNYTRIFPHFCAYSNGQISTSLSTSGTVDLNVNLVFGVPTSASWILVNVVGRLYGGNVLNQLDSIILSFCFATGCALTSSERFEMSIKEFVAINNLEILTISKTMQAPLHNGLLTYTTSKVGGAGTNNNLYVIGYYD